MAIRDLIYTLYKRRLLAQVAAGPVPRHVALVMDGNRRWARQMGFDNPSVGHRYGADHVSDVLDWCADAGIGDVTVFVASTDNLTSRPSAEVQFLMQVIEDVVTERLVQSARWRVHVAGRLDVLPDSTARALKRAVEETRDCTTGANVTVAVGYGGQEEVVDALRSLFLEHAEAGQTIEQIAQAVTPEAIAAHLYTAGRPDPDLVIRTSGEQRLSGFLLWQTAYSQLYFCDTYWPAFRHIDFLRALRTYAARARRDRSA